MFLYSDVNITTSHILSKSKKWTFGDM